MSKKKKSKIISVYLNESQKLIEMGNKIKDGFAKIKYYASDQLHYEEYDEPIFKKI